MTSDHESRFRAVFDELADIPDSEWRHFWSHVQERRYAAREHLIREAESARTMHFILSGLVRLYHNQDGRELVRGFDYENRFVAEYESVLTGEPAAYSVQAIEPTHTLAFPGEVFRRLYDRHPCWDRVGRRILEAQTIRRADKERRFRVYTPEAHYRLLVERGSPLIDRVPLNQLASFLQITPETLSRIRARMRDQAQDAGAGSRGGLPVDRDHQGELDSDQGTNFDAATG
jgi:CRP-like cAMP-binding protein